MLHPSYTDLMNVVNQGAEDEGNPIVSSRYSIVMATSKRARQLIDGQESYVNPKGKKPLSVAVEELAEGKIQILSAGEEEEEQVEMAEASAIETTETAEEV